MSQYLNEERRQLVDALSRYLEREHRIPESGVATAEAPRRQELSAHWAAFTDFGLLGLSVDEQQGGIYDDPLSVYAVMEQFGRHLLREPYVSTVVQGARLLVEVADVSSCAKAWLDQMFEGRSQVAVAHAEPQTDSCLHNVQTRAEQTGDTWRLSGHKVFVTHAAQADIWLVLARTRGHVMDQDGLSLFAVDPQAEGIRCRAYCNLDGAPAAELWFDDVQVPAANLIGPVHQAWPMFAQACARTNVALCAEAVGIMSVVLETTVDYVKARKQFGVTIGSFQAIQHRLVDMYMQLEKARSLSLHASTVAGYGEVDVLFAATAAAKIVCCQSARFISQNAIQLHGGIGMTDELVLGQYVKRLMVIAQTLGDEQHHIQQFIELTQAPRVNETAAQH